MASSHALKDAYIQLTPKNRLHGSTVPVVGLTGGIATGKSTVSELLKAHGLLVIDADQLVKEIYAMKEVQDELIKLTHPENFISSEGLQFTELRRWAFRTKENREALENLIYPRLPQAFRHKLTQDPEEKVIIYDVPLLFEKKLDSQVDLTVCVYAPRSVQQKRLTLRDHLSEEEARAILDEQIDIEKKRHLADVVLDNTKQMQDLEMTVGEFLAKYFYETNS